MSFSLAGSGGDVGNGGRSETPALGSWVVVGGSGGKCRLTWSLGGMRDAGGVAVFGLGTSAQPQERGRRGDGIRSEFAELPPEACSRFRAETNPAASSFLPITHPPREIEWEWIVPKRSDTQTHRCSTCRPGACKPLPSPVHFVDRRTHLWVPDCFMTPVFYSVPCVLILRGDYFYLLVPEDGIPVLLLARQVNT